MIVRAPTHWLGASAITVWPFVFLSPEVPTLARSTVLAHEQVHLEQQRRWAVYGLGVGLLLWYPLYLFVLPIGWNPFRARWEREAMAATGMGSELIRRVLRGPPYWLWFQ